MARVSWDMARSPLLLFPIGTSYDSFLHEFFSKATMEASYDVGVGGSGEMPAKASHWHCLMAQRAPPEMVRLAMSRRAWWTSLGVTKTNTGYIYIYSIYKYIRYILYVYNKFVHMTL